MKMQMLSPKARRDALEGMYSEWPRRTLAQHFEAQAEKYGERPLILTETNEYSYAAVWREGRHYAKALLALGVKRRDHVAVLMANEPEYLFLMVGIWLLGAVCVPINTMLKTEEINYLLKQSDSEWLFLHQLAGGVEHGKNMADIFQDLVNENRPHSVNQIVCVQNTEESVDSRFMLWGDFLRRAADVSESELSQRISQSLYPDEVADIIYTSGSTGLPKGVLLTHEMFLRCGYSTAMSRAFEDGRRVFTGLPLYHVFALVEGILAVSFVGGALVIVPSFSPLRSLEIIEKRKANDILCVPSMLVALLNQPSVESFNLSSLYALMCAAAPAPIAVWERAIEILGLSEICAGYGGTEATAATVHTEVGDPLEMLVTRVGRIKPGGVSGIREFRGANVQYKTIDVYTGEDLPAGEVGELTVRGNLVTHGYYHKPEETAAVIDKDGWLRTGDLGRVDEYGYIELLGRSKELYKLSGENVAPREIEDVINRHPAVAQAYVVGVKDIVTTEAGAAFIELLPGATLTRREVVSYCQANMARFKVPRHVWFVTTDEWPMTGTGKIQKFRLQEMAQSRMSTAHV
jgi:fatty-acyl-CoA synthase